MAAILILWLSVTSQRSRNPFRPSPWWDARWLLQIEFRCSPFWKKISNRYLEPFYRATKQETKQGIRKVTVGALGTGCFKSVLISTSKINASFCLWYSSFRLMWILSTIRLHTYDWAEVQLSSSVFSLQQTRGLKPISPTGVPMNFCRVFLHEISRSCSLRMYSYALVERFRKMTQYLSLFCPCWSFLL